MRPAMEALAVLRGHQILRGVPCCLIDDWLMQTLVDIGAIPPGVCDLADIDSVGEHAVDVFLREWFPTADGPILARPLLRCVARFDEN